MSQRLSAVARQREGGGFDSQGLNEMVDGTQTDGHPTSANMKGCAECRGSCRTLIGSSRLSRTENICGSKIDECVIIIIFEFFFQGQFDSAFKEHNFLSRSGTFVV